MFGQVQAFGVVEGGFPAVADFAAGGVDGEDEVLYGVVVVAICSVYEAVDGCWVGEVEPGVSRISCFVLSVYRLGEQFKFQIMITSKVTPQTLLLLGKEEAGS